MLLPTCEKQATGQTDDSELKTLERQPMGGLSDLPVPPKSSRKVPQDRAGLLVPDRQEERP